MGTDIHTSIEYKVDGAWQKYIPDKDKDSILVWKEERNYNLFGYLSGIRRLVALNISEKGLPEDTTEETSIEYGDGTGWHNPGWVMMSSLMNIPVRLSPDINRLENMAVALCKKYGVDNVRMVFWYDS